MARGTLSVLITSLLVVVLDQISKYWAERVGNTTLNAGVSFGWLQTISAGWMLVLLSLVWMGVTYYLVKTPNFNSLGRGLIIGGGLGNLIDRVLWGGVRDWLPIPGVNLTNNLADYALVIGCLVILMTHYLSKPTKNVES